MKLGKCPGCQRWRVLVNVRRCGSVQQVLRRHGTCPRTPPLTIRLLEESSV